MLFDEQKTLLLSKEIPALEPLTAVPLHATVWLLGSGLLALVGVARSRSKSSYAIKIQRLKPLHLFAGAFLCLM